jgi:hypothetical protein
MNVVSRCTLFHTVIIAELQTYLFQVGIYTLFVMRGKVYNCRKEYQKGWLIELRHSCRLPVNQKNTKWFSVKNTSRCFIKQLQ